MFLAWAFVKLLGEKQTTAFDFGGSKYILFENDRVTEWERDQTMTHYLDRQLVFGLSNSNSSNNSPPSGFLRTSTCYVVQATSPVTERWYQWSKESLADFTVMDVWSISELRDWA